MALLFLCCTRRTKGSQKKKKLKKSKSKKVKKSKKEEVEDETGSEPESSPAAAPPSPKPALPPRKPKPLATLFKNGLFNSRFVIPNSLHCYNEQLDNNDIRYIDTYIKVISKLSQVAVQGRVHVHSTK